MSDQGDTTTDQVGTRRLRLAAVVLAAGQGSRFGGRKMVAELDGRPLLQHVLDVIAGIEVEPLVVVVSPGLVGSDLIEWRGARHVVNLDAARGLSSSLRLGLEAILEPDPVDGVWILLGDQPRTALSTLLALAAAAPRALADGSMALIPDYAEGGGANPVLLLRAGFPLVDRLIGDQGLADLASHPDLVHRVPLSGGNPDVDTPADLRAVERRV